MTHWEVSSNRHSLANASYNKTMINYNNEVYYNAFIIKLAETLFQVNCHTTGDCTLLPGQGWQRNRHVICIKTKMH